MERNFLWDYFSLVALDVLILRKFFLFVFFSFFVVFWLEFQGLVFMFMFWFQLVLFSGLVFEFHVFFFLGGGGC